MIGRLRGRVCDRGADGSCVIDVNGVGYEVHLPLSTLGRLTTENDEITLFIHTHVREEALTLYGFSSLQDREVFRKLLSVSSVGPRIAIGILGVMTGGELAQAVARGDRARFKGISGVGKKTVDRLLLELKDKLGSELPGTAAANTPAAPVPGASLDPLAQVADALMRMGYKRAEAVQAVNAIAPEAEDKPLENLLREALAALA